MQAGSGIAEIVALEISRHEKKSVDEARKRIYLLDSKGLVTKARYESLQEFKKPYAHEHPACPTFLSAIKALKPTAIIGTSGQHGAFTKEGLEELASYQDLPIVFALSNPTSKSECTAEEAFEYTKVWTTFLPLLIISLYLVCYCCPAVGQMSSFCVRQVSVCIREHSHKAEEVPEMSLGKGALANMMTESSHCVPKCDRNSGCLFL
jgi:hypothetical protein